MAFCSECTRPRHAKGLCRHHYNRAYRLAHLDAIRERNRRRTLEKGAGRCARCDGPKPAGRGRKLCDECRPNVRPDEEHRHYWIFGQYGLTLDEYDQLLARQGGVCAICRSACSTGRQLAVDHDHTTGEVRGLLCYLCNNALGKFKDNPELLVAALQYLGWAP